MSRLKFEIQYHAGNPNICRLKGLDISQLPECEGGAFTLPRDQAEYLDGLRAENERLRAALRHARKTFEVFEDEEETYLIDAALSEATS